ncbi:acyl-CoA dehydrogenase family protein, partial [Bdellovibrionota bacterium FG-2]
MNFYSDSKEWQYLFRNAVDWDSIIPLYYPTFPTVDGFNNKEEIISFLEELLANTGKWTAETLAPRARQLDKIGAGTLVDGTTVPSDVLQATYNEARDMDLLGMYIDPKYGGIGAPLIAGMTAFTQVSRACISTSCQLGFFSTIAEMIDRYCPKEFADELIPRIQKLEISGCMCMTEPDSGSDVGALRTSAEKQSDGTYLLNGTKCFITNAGGGLAFILARIKGAPMGLDGLSMFFAREWLTDPKSGKKKHNYKVAKIEEKMGMHGTFTCEMVYD